jgi:hypothetical protein
MSIPGYSDESSSTGLGIDQFNVYVDPGNERQDGVVDVQNPYSGNYIIVGNPLDTTAQILQGLTSGVINVLIAPNGGDTIEPGSENDVVWGAPAATDQNNNASSGSVLDLSGLEPGSKQLYNTSINLTYVFDGTDGPEWDIQSGLKILKAHYITTIIGGNGLDIVYLPPPAGLAGQTLTFTESTADGNGLVTTVTSSDGWQLAFQGFSQFELDGNAKVTVSGTYYEPAGSNDGGGGSAGTSNTSRVSPSTSGSSAGGSGSATAVAGVVKSSSTSSATGSSGSMTAVPTGSSSPSSGASGPVAGSFTLDTGNGSWHGYRLFQPCQRRRNRRRRGTGRSRMGRTGIAWRDGVGECPRWVGSKSL